MPVIVYFHGAGTRANQSCDQNDQLAQDADTMGYALVCADAVAQGSWQFPETDDGQGVTNDDPRPCGASDSEDWTYVKKILQHLESPPVSQRVDLLKVYFMGFSQGAMMTAYAATCFANKIRGAAQAGSGLKLHSNAVTNQFCTASANNRCWPNIDDGVSNPFLQPEDEDVCLFDTCTYFPLQPTKQENIVGEDLKWCLYMGCDDPLAHSVNHMAVYLNSRGVPNNLEKYNGEHQVPTSWMTKVAECHGIFTGPTDSSGVTCSSDSFFEQTR
jgi:predicted esterase